MLAVENIRPMPGWALCRTLVPVEQSRGGIFLARDMEMGKTTEGAAVVLRAAPSLLEDGTEGELDFAPGDTVLIRDFHKFINPVGDLVGADRNDRVFLLNNQDVFAVVTGSGTLGFYGEYEITAG